MKHRCLKTPRSLDQQVALNGRAQQDLLFWIDLLPSWNGSSIIFSSADLVISSDASRTGWGICLSGSLVFGHWECGRGLIVSTGWSSTQPFWLFRCLPHSTVTLLLMDNIPAIPFINHKGRTRSKLLSDLAMEM